MDRQIVVPLDGSVLAEAALPHAQLLARSSNSELQLVRVVAPSPVLYSYAWPDSVPALAQQVEAAEAEAAREYLNDVSQRLSSQNVPIHTTVLYGDPASTLIDYAQTHAAVREIVLATHGRSGFKRWLLGSVAERLIQATPVPVMVVSANAVTRQPAIGYRSLLVPLDGSPIAEQTLGLVQIIADWYGADIHLLHVVEPPPTLLAVAGAEPRVLWELYERNDILKQAQAYLTETAQKLRTKGFNVEVHVVEGQPVTAITSLATELDSDLVALTTHGRSGLKRLWLGSVAAQVVRTCAQPVLLTREYAMEQRSEPETIVPNTAA